MFLVAAIACSPYLLETAVEGLEVSDSGMMPLTRGIQDEPLPDDAELSRVQTDHYMILIHHVAFCDSLFVQTLTEDDLDNLKMTGEERAFSEQYVVDLNEFYRLYKGE